MTPFLMALLKFAMILIVIALIVHFCICVMISYYFQEKKDYWMHMIGVAGKVMQEVNSAKKNKEVKNGNESSANRP